MDGVKILVVDDEKKLVKLVAAYLERDGFEVVPAYDGMSALDLFEKESPDLVVLDIMLPGLDGLEFCRRVRAHSRTPIIILSARGEEVDRLVGLEMGADDYVTKPFSPRELVARVKAVLRRTQLDEGEALVRGPLVIDLARHMVTAGAEEVTLTATEFALLHGMAQRPGQVFSRSQMLSMSQGDYYEGYERTIDTHVKNIRKKLKGRLDDWEFIDTVHGVGYRFVARQKV
ncbi:MAG: response regulator transcription factor [Actinobacteria bacterium]|nr:response regulator transcription factor [Actinomycetota bacterium]MBU1944833.1 response regulator transcription factor [Actinomycetota bacterium]MBU2687100.1 response regulator transcription factor [Actinomycetota bacterium]